MEVLKNYINGKRVKSNEWGMAAVAVLPCACWQADGAGRGR